MKLDSFGWCCIGIGIACFLVLLAVVIHVGFVYDCETPGGWGYYSDYCVRNNLEEIKDTLDELWLNVEALRENQHRK